MGYLDGFRVTFSKLFEERRRPATTQGRGRQAGQAGPPPRPPRPQPLRGRHGEVHRLRAVRRRVPGPLHLRARRRQPARRPGLARASGTASSTRSTTCAASTATCASRPARPRPSPSRSCSSSPSPTASDAIYTKAELVVDDDGRPQQLPWEDWSDIDDVARTPRPGCGPPRRPGRPPTRAGCRGRASSASACGRPSRASRCPRARRHGRGRRHLQPSRRARAATTPTTRPARDGGPR